MLYKCTSVTDNSDLPQDDKLAKIRTYLELMKKLYSLWRFFRHLLIDEQMIPYLFHIFYKSVRAE